MSRVLAMLLVTATLASCSGSGTDGEKAMAPVALVRLTAATSGAVSEQISLYGAAEAGAGATTTLAASEEARIVRILAPVGTRVGSGQLIVQLAPGPTSRLDLIRANSDARAADAAYARAGRLRQDGLVGNGEVEQARAAAATAGATRASLAQRTASLALRAPSGGIVQAITGSPGDIVQPGTSIATIVRDGDVRARFGVDPAVARALRPGQPIRIQGSGGRTVLTVPIDAVDPVVDPQTRLAAVFARLPVGARIGTGEILSASVTTSSVQSLPSVPYAALMDDGGQPYVFVVKNGTARRRDVQTGPIDRQSVAIVAGVKPGDQVVVEGGTAIEDGMKVRTR